MNVFTYLYYLWSHTWILLTLKSSSIYLCHCLGLGCAVVISWKSLAFLTCSCVWVVMCNPVLWLFLLILLGNLLIPQPTLETDHSGAANTLLLGEASTSCSQLELGQFSSLLWVAQAFPLSFSTDVYSVWDDFPQWDQMQAASSTAFHPKVPSLFANFKLTFGLYKICMTRFCGDLPRW